MVPQPRLIILQPTTYCNIDCSYCYLGRRDLRLCMSEAVLEAVVSKVAGQLGQPERTAIVWHGGEPTTAGLLWFRRAYAILQPARAAGIRFAVQTNGVALNDAWFDFFAETAQASVSASMAPATSMTANGGRGPAPARGISPPATL